MDVWKRKAQNGKSLGLRKERTRKTQLEVQYVIQDDEYEEHSVKYVHAFTRSDGTRYSK